MKTLDEAMECIKCAERPDSAEGLMKMENVRQFGLEVASSESAVCMVVAMAHSYLEGKDTITSETLIEFGLSNFTAGVRIGVEMERSA